MSAFILDTGPFSKEVAKKTGIHCNPVYFTEDIMRFDTMITIHAPGEIDNKAYQRDVIQKTGVKLCEVAQTSSQLGKILGDGYEFIQVTDFTVESVSETLKARFVETNEGKVVKL